MSDDRSHPPHDDEFVRLMNASDCPACEIVQRAVPSAFCHEHRPPDPTPDDLSALIDAHIEQQGCCVMRVSDGYVITFTTETLAKLLDASTRGPGRVMVLVRQAVTQ